MPSNPLTSNASRLKPGSIGELTLGRTDVLDTRMLAPVAAGPANVARTAVDAIVACGLCCALAPVMLATVGLVKLSSPGPIFHRRRVLGRYGIEFDALKFRTMVASADEQLRQDLDLRKRFEVNFKLPGDPRVTAVGRWLRRYSLDELPQLFNVLRGEMALVGPRMISPPELVRYGLHAEQLLSVKPGLTGLWQVSGRQLTGYEERVRLDMHYLTHRSIWLDARILARTLPAVVRARGAC